MGIAIVHYYLECDRSTQHMSDSDKLRRETHEGPSTGHVVRTVGIQVCMQRLYAPMQGLSPWLVCTHHLRRVYAI